MFEAKGPHDFVTRAHITTTATDRHFSPNSGHVYFYDQSGDFVFGFASQELTHLLKSPHTSTWREAPISHRLGNKFGKITDRKTLIANIKTFELDNTYVTRGLIEVMNQEHRHWAQLQLTPDCSVNFLQLTKRGDTKSAVMSFNQLPYLLSLSQLFVLQGLSYGYTETELSKLYGNKSAARVYSILNQAVARNGYLETERTEALSEMLNDLERLDIFEPEAVGKIEQRIYDLHQEVQTLPAHLSTF